MNALRLDKSLAKQLVVQVAPEYLQMFRELQRPRGWQKMAEKFGSIRKRLKLDSYVHLYEDENRLIAAFGLGLFGVDGFKELSAELQAANEAEQQGLVDEFARDVLDEGALDGLFPETETEEARQKAQFDALSEEKKQDTIKNTQHLLAFFLGFFLQHASGDGSRGAAHFVGAEGTSGRSTSVRKGHPRG